MSYYVYGGKLSYQDYLTARSFSKDIASATREAGNRVSMEVSRQTREIIASNDALAREGITAMAAANEQLSGVLSEGFSELSYELRGIGSGISELNATFHWGFGQMIASMGRMNDALSELIKVSKTPAQTAAYEQYEIARDAYRQGLYAECLEALEKAVSGDHTSPGYKLEWRFHQMKGAIQLGFAGCDFALANHAKAEETFLLAARYAKADYPEHAGQAFLSAGWAAYCQGKMKEALSHTEQAIAVHPRLGEAFFQLAKVRMAIGDVDQSLPTLARAIDIDHFYSLKAAGDGDFQKHDKELRQFIDALRTEKYQQSLPLVKATLEKLQIWRENNPDVAKSEASKQLDVFLAEGGCWPLFDVLSMMQEMDSIAEKVKAFPVTITIHSAERETSYEETFPVEETYQEQVVIRKGGFFRKPISEIQNKIRIVNKARTITRKIAGAARIDFCYVPGGTFKMKIGRDGKDEKDVTISPGFLMGKYPITQSQWEAIMGTNPSHFKGPDHPVDHVSWYDCLDFIERINLEEGANIYRLPTSAEWEYSCRAGTQTRYFFNDGQASEYCWYKDNSQNSTHPVGGKKPNAFGLYDMLGNVFEWCVDQPDGFEIKDWTKTLKNEEKARRIEEMKLLRVIRGGSWNWHVIYCERYFWRPAKDTPSEMEMGFRLLRIV
jgi:tetratricopeptide (TPR) repeat protein